MTDERVRSRRRRRAVVRVIGILCGLAIGLAGAEFALRLLGGGPERVETVVPWREFPADKCPRMVTRSVQRTKPDGHYRIVALGDSFTWGSGVHGDDAYPARLERRLQRHYAGIEVDVLNAGRRGYNTRREYATLRKRRLHQYEPDLVIVGFCLNDPEPFDRKKLAELRVEFERAIPVEGLGGALYRGSRLFHLIWERLENERQLRAHTAYYRLLYEPDQPYRDEMRKSMRKIRDHLTERSIPLLIVIFPMFDSDLDHGYRYRDMHAWLVEAFAADQISTLDLLPYFDGMDGERLAVIPFSDPHPSEIAHRIAADALFEHLVDTLDWPVAPAAEGR